MTVTNEIEVSVEDAIRPCLYELFMDRRIGYYLGLALQMMYLNLYLQLKSFVL